MRIGVIAKLVTLRNNALNYIRIGLCVGADNEECRNDVLGLQDVKDLRRPLAVRSVIEGERDSFRPAAILADDIVGGNLDISLVGDVAGERVDFDAAHS